MFARNLRQEFINFTVDIRHSLNGVQVADANQSCYGSHVYLLRASSLNRYRMLLTSVGRTIGPSEALCLVEQNASGCNEAARHNQCDCVPDF